MGTLPSAMFYYNPTVHTCGAAVPEHVSPPGRFLRLFAVAAGEHQAPAQALALVLAARTYSPSNQYRESQSPVSQRSMVVVGMCGVHVRVGVGYGGDGGFCSCTSQSRPY